MMRTTSIALCCLLLLSSALVAQEISLQEEIIVHVRPADRSTLSTAEEREFLSAATFGARFYEAGDFESALQQLRVADRLLPGHPALLYNLVVVLARYGLVDEAEVKLHMYRALYPDGVEMPQIQRLQIDLEWLREVQSRANLTKAYADLFDRGRTSFASGEYASAADAFAQARQSQPGDAAASFNQALALEALGDYTASMNLLGELLAARSDGVNLDAVEMKVALLNAELMHQKSSIVCGFCGRRLPGSGAWCPDCGHGPFVPESAQWNARSCTPGSTATRATFLSTGAPHQTETLACLHAGTYGEALRYSTAKRRAIQTARKADGWSYDGERIAAFRQGDGMFELQHENDQLVRIVSPTSGDVLERSGRLLDDGRWQVTAEDRVIDGQKFRKEYAYDARGRIVRETVRYQTANSCGNVIEVQAAWNYNGEQLQSVALEGGYDGYASEGSPQMRWRGTVGFMYYANGMLQRESLNIDSYEKTYTKLTRELRRDLEKHYPDVRADAPQYLLARGDVCGASTVPATNLIDLRAFDAWSPNLAVVLPAGVTRVLVDFQYR